MPPWIQAENISLYEQSELNVLKCFTYVPVVITFGVFLFLLVYYVAFFLYPSILGDYYGTWGIAYMWPNQQALEESQYDAKLLALVFVFSSTNLFISLIMTITTSPGLIPEDREWDMPDPSQEEQREVQHSMSRDQQQLRLEGG